MGYYIGCQATNSRGGYQNGTLGYVTCRHSPRTSCHRIELIPGKRFIDRDRYTKRSTVKSPIFRDSSASSASDADDQITDAVIDTIEGSNDKVIEIRPVKRSSVSKRVPALLLIGSAVGALFWWRKSETPSETVQSVASKTAQRTKQVTERAAEALEGGGETVAEEVEEGSQKASEQVEQIGEEVAETTEAAGEKVSKRADETSYSTGSYAEMTEDTSGSSDR